MINCAVIGAGQMGQQHCRVLKKLSHVNLVSVCDKNLPADYQDYRLMLKKETIDAVIVATPTKSHYLISRDCLKAGKHVLVEKPITETVEQAKRLINLAKTNQLILTVGHIERFNPAIKKLKAMVQNNQLGGIKSMICQRLGLFDQRVKNTNVVKDIAIHDLDIVNYLLASRPKKINACGGRAILKKQIDYADILLDYGSASVHIQVNWITPIKVRKLLIAGTKGYVELDYLQQTLNYYRHRYSQNYADFKQLIDKFDRRPQRIKIRKEEPLKLELQSFCQDIVRHRQPQVTPEEGLAALKIALKISKMIQG